MDKLNLNDREKIKMTATFNAAADHFDDAPLAFGSECGRRTVELIDLHAGWKVLDVGCGTGASALAAAEFVGPAGKVIGIDLAERLLEQAQFKAAQRQLSNVEFCLGDMTELGYPDTTFDAVISVFSICFVPDMRAQARALWRMVKPGGKLAITTWGPNFFEPGYTLWRRSVLRIRPDLFSVTEPWDRITTPDQVRNLLHSVGVTNAEIVLEKGTQAMQSPEDWWAIVLGSRLRGTVEAMSTEEATLIRNHIVSWIRSHNVKSIPTNVIYAIATKG